jgi:hypothetical protein
MRPVNPPSLAGSGRTPQKRETMCSRPILIAGNTVRTDWIM